jgi:hypothetical protein
MAPRDDLTRRLLTFIRQTAPSAYCDACLALRLGASLAELSARLATLLAEGKEFERRRRACYGCGRTLPLTGPTEGPRQ